MTPRGAVMLTTALMAVGLVMVASTTLSPHGESTAGFLRTPFGRQCAFVTLGLITLALTVWLARPVLSSASWSTKVAWFFFVVVTGALVAMLIPGVTEAQRGSHRWLSLTVAGFLLGVQPSEFAKPAMVGLLATWLGRRDADPRSLTRGFLPATMIIGLTVALVGKEDFGTCALLAAVGGVMLLTAGCRWRYLFLMGVIGGLGLAALIWAEPYRLKRITAFQDIWADARGGGYQPLQSLTTIASGGWFGTGLGAGVQKYGYLPESHTDFIFAVICEEMGVFGGLLVIGLYASFVFMGWRIALAAATRIERLLAIGLTVTFGLQAVMNIAVVTVMTPTTGISLPLVSAGGSGIVVFCMATGVLSAIALRARLPGLVEPMVDFRPPIGDGVENPGAGAFDSRF